MLRHDANEGSDLHIYRGHDGATKHNFILGHEVLGEIIEKGSAVTNFELGQVVLAPFSTSCGEFINFLACLSRSIDDILSHLTVEKGPASTVNKVTRPVVPLAKFSDSQLYQVVKPNTSVSHWPIRVFSPCLLIFLKNWLLS